MLHTASPLPPWRAYRAILGGLILAAWLILVISAATPYGALLDHNQIEEGLYSAFVRWPAFLGGWTLMVVAMMLPGALPALKSFMEAAAASEAASGRLLRSFVLGYLAIWVAFGAAIYLGDTLLHEAVEGGLLPNAVEPLIPVVLLSVAGLYQFTPLRQSCQAKCLLPQAPLRLAGAGSFYRGLSAGLLCLGTCGAAMLVMFALGGGVSLAWMVALTGLSVVERTTEGGRYVPWLLGLVLVLWAALQLVGGFA